MRSLLASLLVAGVFVVACAPTPPTPAATPPAAAQPAALTAVPKAAGTAAAGSQAAGQEWDRVVAAAKQEGTVAVIGNTGVERRESLTIPFEQKYGIKVEYLADAGAGVPPRLSSERAAGQFVWDILVAGALESLILPMDVLEPLDPAFILPEVKDPKAWRGGSHEFMDDGHTVLVMTPFRRGTLFFNTAQVKSEEITSYRDLLQPKWKGKIVIDDPRKAGPGQATFTFFFMHPDLGPDFIRGLARQELTILRDYAQEVDTVGQGHYPLAVGTSDSLVEERARQGVPIGIVDPRQLKEGSDVSPASGQMGMFKNAPHPNAARVYVNWLLSQEGQISYTRAAGYVSARLDVPTDHAAPWRVPQPGDIKTYGIPARKVVTDQLNPLLTEVFGA